MAERLCSRGSREEIEAILAAQRELYLKPDDRVLVVADDEYGDIRFMNLLRGFPFTVARIPKIERPGQDYSIVDPSVVEGKTTVAWLVTSVSISHAPTTRKLLDRGIWIISNPGITPDWRAVLDPANRGPCKRLAESILDAIGGDVGCEIEITVGDGTNLRLRVPNGNWEPEIGERKGIGTNGLFGELFTAPYWAEGVLVLRPGDFLTNPINKVTQEIVIRVRENEVTDISGGREAGMLADMLDEGRLPFCRILGEFAFQLNPARPARIYRSVVAEKLAGGIHVAIGTNSVCLKSDCPDLGLFKHGRYSAGVHVDCIKFGANVTVRVGDREIRVIRGGKLWH